jgi:hypothetical protein
MLFQHHDGFVRIVSYDLEYHDTVENFIIDLGQAYSGMPDGFITRIYKPNNQHYLSTGDTASPQDLLWSEGDFYISQIQNLIDRKNERITIQEE